MRVDVFRGYELRTVSADRASHAPSALMLSHPRRYGAAVGRPVLDEWGFVADAAYMQRRRVTSLAAKQK